MITAPARFTFTRSDFGGYLAASGGRYLGRVERDGRAWVIATTARGDLPGEPHRYATRTDAVDALAAMLHAAERLDAMPTDDEPAEDVCPLCRYYVGHTSWCPNRPLEAAADADPCTCVDTAGDLDDGEHLVGCPSYDRPDRDADVVDLDDAALWRQFMIEERALSYGDEVGVEPSDERHGEVLAEIVRRFGVDATERTADWSVSLHMSCDDLVTWARDEPEHLLAVATGRLVPSWRREDDLEVATLHADCAACERLVESAEVHMRATGSVGSSYGDGEHRAAVARARGTSALVLLGRGA